MKTFTLFKPILLCLAALAITTSCSDDKKNDSIKPSTLKWNNTEQKVTKALYSRESNEAGNLNPKEYFVLETENYSLTIIIPQQYIGLNTDKNKLVWPLLNYFDIRFKDKRDYFHYEMTKESKYPDSPAEVVGGTVKIVSGSNGYYEIDTNINIQFDYGMTSRTEILSVYFNGTMTNDDSINEWVDPTPELRRK